MIYSFTFDGVRKDYIYCDDEKGKRRSTFAPITRNFVTTPGRPGAMLRSTDTQIRVIQQPIFFKGNTEEELPKLEEEIAGWLLTKEVAPLIFDGEPDRTYYAVIDGSLDIDELMAVGEGTINFICPDPYKYGTEVTVPANLPIINEGTAETWPIIMVTFTGVASDFTISHQNGKFVRAIYNFSTGDVLEIDLAKRKALINGIVNMPAYYFRNQPFMLIPGENTLTVEPAGVANVEVTYRPRWK